MRIIITVTLSFILLSAFGQSKYEKRLTKLYNKAKYEKCIRKSKSYLRKEKKSVEFQAFIVKSNFELYKQQSSDSKKKSYLKKSITEYKKLKKYNSENIDFSELITNITQSVKTDVVDYNIRNKEYFHNLLAEVFFDTTTFYRDLHKIIVVKELPKREYFLSDTINMLLNAAENVIGVRYKYGGIDTAGFDCSGFTQYVYKTVGFELPHNANKQSAIGKTINIKDAKAGDLIFFGENRAFHAALIYANKEGNIELMHCVSGGVAHQKSDDQNTIYWLERIYKVQRIFPQ